MTAAERRKRTTERAIRKHKSVQSAWEKYQKSKEYDLMISSLLSHGINHPYCENILYRAFWSGAYKRPFIDHKKEV